MKFSRPILTMLVAGLYGCGGGGGESSSASATSPSESSSSSTSGQRTPSSSAPSGSSNQRTDTWTQNPSSSSGSGSPSSGSSPSGSSGSSSPTVTTDSSTKPSDTSTPGTAPVATTPSIGRDAGYYLQWFSRPHSDVVLYQTDPDVNMTRLVTLTFRQPEPRLTSDPAVQVTATTEDGVQYKVSVGTAGEYLTLFNSWTGAQLLPTYRTGFQTMVDGTDAGFMGDEFCFNARQFLLCRNDERNAWRFVYRPAHGAGEVYQLTGYPQT